MRFAFYRSLDIPHVTVLFSARSHCHSDAPRAYLPRGFRGLVWFDTGLFVRASRLLCALCHSEVSSASVPPCFRIQALLYERLNLGEDLNIDAIAGTLRDLLVLYEEERVEVRATADRINKGAPLPLATV